MSPAYEASDYDSWTESRPDKPLVVKCNFDGLVKRITFSSSRTCTFDALKHRIEQCFALSATGFAITYMDDDGETTDITTDGDLTEAIRYFHPVSDDPPQSSAASILSGRSFGRGKVTLRVKISVEYDGPSLSDTSSLASMEEYKDRNGSDYSFSLNSSLSEEIEDDAITISSKDMGSKHEVFRARGTKTNTSGPSRDLFCRKGNKGSERAVERDWDEQTVSSAPKTHSSSFLKKMKSAASLSSVRSKKDTGSSSQVSTDPSSVFERLKLQESLNTSATSVYASPALSSERGAAWLRDQNARTLKTMLGTLPGPSSSDSEVQSISDGFSLSLSQSEQGEPEQLDETASVISGELKLHKDPHGKFYYAYTATSSGSASIQRSGGSSDDSGYDDGSSTIYDADVSNPNTSDAAQSRPASMQVHYWDQMSPTQPSAPPPSRQPTYSSGVSKASASSPPHLHHPNHRSYSDPVISQITPDIPPELLPFITSTQVPPPELLTQCSQCGELLETLRYVCSTCGEKKSCSRAELFGLHVEGQLTRSSKGKEREQQYLYPPQSIHAYSSASSNSSHTLIADNDPFHDKHAVAPRHKISKPLPPPPLPPRSSSGNSSPTAYPPSSQSNSPISVPSAASSYLSIPATNISSSHSSSSSNDTPISSEGYELCFRCIESAGVIHALEATLAPGSSPVGVNNENGWPPSPEDAQRALSQWRRSAPRRKGQMRHAYLEKVWGPRGWDDVEQDDAHAPKCSTCNTTIVNKRYKCASCKNFNLCRACYSQVHEVHPSHAFLVIPEKPIRAKSEPVIETQPVETDTTGVPSMIHPGVKCMHCMQDIVGARFHCAICESVDICSNCESAGLPGNLDSQDGGHASSHIMIKIPYPLPSDELQIASMKVKKLWDRDAPTLEIPRSRRDSLMSSYARTVIGPSTSAADLQALKDWCDGCKQPIRGVRFQCAHCPSKPTGYNLCENCEPRSYILHDPMHIFFKLPRPVDRPLESEFAILPPLYKYPAGPQGGTYNSADPKGYLQTLHHPSAVCDLCMQRITGEWFRCVYCARDLCENCEAVDTHDETHFFMVFKSGVDMQKFRLFAHLGENAEGSPPVITYPVYQPQS
ncbi:hypothetical protein K474DRAFT_1659161 [Panus rudis PR-1116 ss-1]|nr:hypothetical protein K474DRAFT_1659161 [Panus rudis PR-1116 ss-1]